MFAKYTKPIWSKIIIWWTCKFNGSIGPRQSNHIEFLPISSFGWLYKYHFITKKFDSSSVWVWFKFGSISVRFRFAFGSSSVWLRFNYTVTMFPAGIFSEVIFLQLFWFCRDYFPQWFWFCSDYFRRYFDFPGIFFCRYFFRRTSIFAGILVAGIFLQGF